MYRWGVHKIFVGASKIWPDPPQPDPPPLRQTAQNFALFSLSRRKIRSFLLSLGVLSWNFGGVFETPGPSKVHVWALVLSCEAPGKQVRPKHVNLAQSGLA